MKSYKPWAAAVLIWTAALLLNGAARISASFAEWYARHVYPLWVNTLGRLFSPLPFSLAELLLYAGAAWALFCLVRLAARALRKDGRRRERLAAWLRRAETRPMI